MIRRLKAASIWAPNVFPASERKYAVPLKRVVFPVFDVIVALLGIFGTWAGFTALQLTFPDPVPGVLYGMLIITGVVCGVASQFPVLWPVEIVGKLLILATLSVLLVAMLIAATQIEGHPGLAMASMIAGLMLVPSLGVWILGVEWAGRKGAAWIG